MEKQLEHFGEYKLKLQSIIGAENAQTHIQNAVFIIVAGQNDVGVTYLTLPTVRIMYTVEGYETFLLLKVNKFVQGLWNNGARRMGVFGLLPLGATPAVITLRKESANYYTAVAEDYNEKLQKELPLIQKMLEGSRIGYGDLFNPLLDSIQNPHKYGMSPMSLLNM